MPSSPVQRAQRRVERARRELDTALGELNAALTGEQVAQTHLSVPEAVLAVMRETSGSLDTAAIHSALAKRDQLPGGAEVMKGLRVALSRLVKRGQLVRISDGVYQLPAKSSTTGKAPRH